MNRGNQLRAALLAFGTLLAAGMASAGPRDAETPKQGEDKDKDKAETAVDPDVWMKRLVGRYRIDGSIHHEEITDFDARQDTPDKSEGSEVMLTSMRLNQWDEPVQGKADCIDFADGPGLRCVINIAWPEMWRGTGKAQLGGVSDMSPAIVLAGVAPTSGGVRFLLVNSKGLANPGALALGSNSASARPACVNLPGVMSCEQRFSITAKADAKNVFVQMSTSVRFHRNKTERKLFLEKINPDDPNSRLERSSEGVEELLNVSFSLQRVSEDEAPQAPKLSLKKATP